MGKSTGNWGWKPITRKNRPWNLLIIIMRVRECITIWLITSIWEIRKQCCTIWKNIINLLEKIYLQIYHLHFISKKDSKIINTPNLSNITNNVNNSSKLLRNPHQILPLNSFVTSGLSNRVSWPTVELVSQWSKPSLNWTRSSKNNTSIRMAQRKRSSSSNIFRDLSSTTNANLTSDITCSSPIYMDTCEGIGIMKGISGHPPMNSISAILTARSISPMMPSRKRLSYMENMSWEISYHILSSRDI